MVSVRQLLRAKVIIPIAMAILLGGLHILFVAIPSIRAGGGGDELLYILFIDFPLFLIAFFILAGPLFNSVVFNFLWFSVLGTVMYVVIGYLLGKAVALGWRKLVESKARVKLAFLLGTVHFLVVGIPLIMANGIWERVPYLLFVDFPLFIPANMLAAGSLDGSPALNYALFAFLGTVMYGGAGYLIGRWVVKGGK